MAHTGSSKKGKEQKQGGLCTRKTIVCPEVLPDTFPLRKHWPELVPRATYTPEGPGKLRFSWRFAILNEIRVLPSGIRKGNGRNCLPRAAERPASVGQCQDERCSLEGTV